MGVGSSSRVARSRTSRTGSSGSGGGGGTGADEQPSQAALSDGSTRRDTASMTTTGEAGRTALTEARSGGSVQVDKLEEEGRAGVQADDDEASDESAEEQVCERFGRCLQ